MEISVVVPLYNGESVAQTMAIARICGKLGGMDAEVIFVDDQRKPDLGGLFPNCTRRIRTR